MLSEQDKKEIDACTKKAQQCLDEVIGYIKESPIFTKDYISGLK